MSNFDAQRTIWERKFEDLLIDICKYVDCKGVLVAVNTTPVFEAFNFMLNDMKENAESGTYILKPDNKE